MKKVIFLASLLTVAGCTKEKIVEVPKPGTSITIEKPAFGDMIHNGDLLHIKGSIKSPEKVHGYSISIRNEDEEAEVFFADFHMHSSDIAIDTTWACQVTGDCDMTLKIDATTDHEGHSEGLEVGFHCSH